jgi:hypothetical protein
VFESFNDRIIHVSFTATFPKGHFYLMFTLLVIDNERASTEKERVRVGGTLGIVLDHITKNLHGHLGSQLLGTHVSIELGKGASSQDMIVRTSVSQTLSLELLQ